MRISVALCVYNGEKFLGEQLESIARQIRTPDEIIICDDQSTDRSVAMIEDFAAAAPFEVHFERNDQNLGVTANFEKAIARCQGDIIATSDQDDVWAPLKLARIEPVFEESPDVSLVFSNANLVDGQGQLLGSRLWSSVRFDRWRRREVNDGDAFGVLLKRPVITGATMAFRSALRDVALPIPAGWLHDEWIGLMAAASSRIVALPELLMNYRRHANNQVGVLGVNVAERARASLRHSRESFLDRAQAFEILKIRLAETFPDRFDLERRVAEKIAHFRARGSLPDSRVDRIPGILRELLSGNYTRYSGSTLGFIRDFFARD